MIEADKAFSAHSFVLETADLKSPFLKDQQYLDIRNIIVDIDIFEDINKAYLTGNIVIHDDTALYSFASFRGIEYIQLGFKLPDTDNIISKTFYIDKIVRTQRANDQQSIIMFHIREDVGYISEYINCRSALRGKGYEIIRQIFKEFFDKEVDNDPNLTTDSQPPFQVIVPNISPLAAVDWIKDRITGPNATPFYVYSTLVDKNIQLRNWETMVTDPRIVKSPLIYSQSQTNNQQLTINQQSFTIENFQDRETSDIVRLNDSAFVNAKYFLIDINSNSTISPGNSDFTTSNGPITTIPYGKRWSARGMFYSRYFNNPAPPPNPVPRGGMTPQYPQAFEQVGGLYPEYAKLPWSVTTPPSNLSEGLNPYLHNRPESRVVVTATASVAYPEVNSYTTYDREDYLLTIDAKALRNWIMSTPITVTLPGRLFISGTQSATLGRKYQLQFTTFIKDVAISDPRRTGDYIVVAARHSFSRDSGYRVLLTCVPLKAVDPKWADVVGVDAPTLPGDELPGGGGGGTAIG